MSACETPEPVDPLVGLPDSIFDPVDEYDGPLKTIGNLADGYAENTTALREANNKLHAICKVANRCEIE